MRLLIIIFLLVSGCAHLEAINEREKEMKIIRKARYEERMKQKREMKLLREARYEKCMVTMDANKNRLEYMYAHNTCKRHLRRDYYGG